MIVTPRLLPLVLIAAPLVLFGCGSTSGPDAGLLPGDDGGPSDAAGESGGFEFDAAGADVPEPPSDSGPPLVIYAHTNTSLYQMDPTSLAVTKLGDFDCVPSQTATMTDVAVNSALDIWSISARAVWKIDVSGGVAHCAQKVPLNNASGVIFYALTFAPGGVLDPTQEVLVAGNTAGELWSIDASGNTALRGNFGTVPADDGNGHSYPAGNVGKPWELSGDVVFLANHGNPIGFATVRDCPSPPSPTGCSYVDTLLEIDLAKLKAGPSTANVTKAVRGQLIRSAACGGGSSGFGAMFGIAAWNDKVYGFSKSGDLVEIDNGNAGTCLVKSYAPLQWDGAGVTTNAPVIPPPVK